MKLSTPIKTDHPPPWWYSCLLRWPTLCQWGVVIIESLSHVQLFETPWIIDNQALLSMGISQARILEWVAFPSPRDLPNPGIKPMSPALAGRFFTIEPSGNPLWPVYLNLSSLTLLWLALEFFPAQSQEITLGGHPRDLLENWDVTILSSPTFFPAQN